MKGIAKRRCTVAGGVECQVREAMNLRIAFPRGGQGEPESFLSAKWNPHYPNLQKPVDRSLDMRALGGAITSPCSNDTGYLRPAPTIFGLNTFYYAVVGLVFNLNIVSKGTLWETARITLCLQMACTVVT